MSPTAVSCLVSRCRSRNQLTCKASKDVRCHFARERILRDVDDIVDDTGAFARPRRPRSRRNYDET